MDRVKLYDFKAISEGQWAIIVGALGALAGSFAQMLGGDAGDVGTTSVVAASVARGIIGIFDGAYEWSAWWEIAWAGLQAGAGAIAFAVTNTTSADALQTTFVATTASSAGRPVFAAVIAAIEKAFSGGLVPPTPPLQP